MNERRKAVLYAASMALVSIVTFGGLSEQPWYYDDGLHFTKVKRVLAQPSWFFDPDSVQPLRVISHLYFLLTYLILGENPEAYHFANVVIHLINAQLVMRAVRHLFNDQLGYVSGFLFLISSSGYWAVYTVANNAALLGTTFALTAVERSHRYLAHGGSHELWQARLAYLACVLSYETHASVIFPLLLLAYGNRQQPRNARALAIVLISCAAGFVAIDLLVYRTATEKLPFNSIDLGPHALQNLGLFVGRLVLTPYASPLGWDDDFSYDLPPDWWTTATVLGGLAIAGPAWASLRHKTPRYATFWVLPTLLPYIFSTNNMYFSRYWYLASVGTTLLIGTILVVTAERLRRNHRHIFLASSFAIVLLTAIPKIREFERRCLVHAANYHLDQRRDYEKALQLYDRALNHFGILSSVLLSNAGVGYDRMGQANKAESTTSGGPSQRTLPTRLPVATWPRSSTMGIAFRRPSTITFGRGARSGALRNPSQAGKRAPGSETTGPGGTDLG